MAGKRFVCIGYGTDKETGAVFYNIAPIFEGKTKDGRPFGMVQMDQRSTTDEPLEIGQIKTFALVSE